MVNIEDDVLGDVVTDEEIEEEIPDKPISSLRDIQYLYGTISVMLNRDVGALGHHSPSEVENLDSAKNDDKSSQSLVIVKIGEDGTVDDVEVTSYNHKRDFQKIGYSYYSASRGSDHSITQKTGKNKKPGEIASYATDWVFGSWLDNKIVKREEESHEDGWIIKMLKELSEDKEEMKFVENIIKEQITDSTQALVTVAIEVNEEEVLLRDEGGGLDVPEENIGKYIFPGQLDIFETISRKRVIHKFIDKNDADNSQGTAVSFLSDSEENVVGMSPDPMKYFLTKNTGRFYLFDSNEAWRSHPTSETEALRLRQSKEFVNSCIESAAGASIYFLPYYREVGAKEFRYLADILSRLSDGGPGELIEHNITENDGEEGPPTNVGSVFAEMYRRAERDGEDLRFYVSIVDRYQPGTKHWQFGDAVHATEVPAITLRDEHMSLLRESSIFKDFFEVYINEDYTIVGTKELRAKDESNRVEDAFEKQLLDYIVKSIYFLRTFPEKQDDTEFAVDDPHSIAQRAVLSGEKLDSEFLIENYAQALEEEERGDDSSRVSVQLMNVEQFVQLHALGKSGLLRDYSKEKFTGFEVDNSTKQEVINMNDNSPAKKRKEKLEQFFESTPFLAENEERKACFLLGALVGQVSKYQSMEGVSKTLTVQYPIGSMTKRKMESAVSASLDKLSIYSSRSDAIQSGLMYSEITEKLPKYFAENPPTEMSLTTREIQFYYSLGISYAMSGGGDSQEEEEKDEVEESQKNTTEQENRSGIAKEEPLNE